MGVKPCYRTTRVAAFFVAALLMSGAMVHASHGHEDATEHASQFHATCVVCQLGSPVAATPVAVHAAIDDAPICHLSIADRDHATPPARVDIDLSRAPPAPLAS